MGLPTRGNLKAVLEEIDNGTQALFRAAPATRQIDDEGTTPEASDASREPGEGIPFGAA